MLIPIRLLLTPTRCPLPARYNCTETSRGGWTLYGTGMHRQASVAAEPLFVDVRGLITAPQYAAYDILGSLFTGDRRRSSTRCETVP